MAITALGTLKEQVRDKLAYLTTVVNASTAVGHTDVNHDAEDLYCGLLNLAFDWNISNTNDDQMNSAAIDLADKDADTLLGRGEKGVALQVTSTVERKKVEHTLTKFAEHNLQSHYKRLIILMIGQKRGYQGEFTLPAGLDFQKTRDIWDTDDLTRELHALHPDKLEAINKYLTEQLPIWQEKAKKPELNLPLPMTMDEDRFVGREDELKEIRAKLEQSSVVYLTGLGGMGKTELAIKFGRKYRDGEVYFVRFQESFERTVSMNVAQGIEGLLEQGPEVAYAQAMKRLGKCGKNDILIIDNADEPSGNFADLKDKTWNKLRNLDMKLLITTRCDVAKAVKVGAMKTELLRQLFQNQESPLKEKQMDDLIDAVRGHTMMVDMMAKTLRRNRRLTAEHLLQTIKDGTLPAERLRAIAIEKNGDTEQEQIYVHLKNLFSMANLSEKDKAVLIYLVLLPDSGLDMEVLEKAIPEDDLDVLDNLTDAGWVNYEPKTKRVSMHPVVRLVCREELKPDDNSCSAFLKALWGQHNRKNYNADRFQQFAMLFSRASEYLSNCDGSWSTKAGLFWEKLGRFQKALDYKLQTVNHLKSNHSDNISLAEILNSVGMTYGNLGDHPTALAYKLEALDIRIKVLEENHPDLARSYHNVGYTYGYMGDHSRALEYKLKSLHIREKILFEETTEEAMLDLAMSYNNVGCTYDDLGKHQEALENKVKALSIRKEALPENHPNLALSYDGVGYTYDCLKDYQRALVYKRKAFEIREIAFEADHPDIATSYNSLGTTYGNLGKHQKALEYKMKGLSIRKERLPSNHPSLATSFENVGITYRALENYGEALKYQMKALSIREQILSTNDPKIAKSCDNVAQDYENIGDYETALNYARRALNIAENAPTLDEAKIEKYRKRMEHLEKLVGEQ